jgi:hypothetical protein
MAGWEVLKTLPAGEKVFLVVTVLTVILTLLCLLASSSLLVLSALGKTSAKYWAICSWCCLVALLGWIVPHSVRLFWGGGMIMVFRNNVVAFWLIVLATLLSAIFAFDSPTRYLVLSAVVGGVGLFSFYQRIFVYGLQLLVRKRFPDGSVRGPHRDH